MELLLIRHGETSWNLEKRLQGSTNIPLNEEGFLQARKCADYMKTLPIDAIYSSPLARAYQTAQAIAYACVLPIIQLNELQEKHFGKGEGKTIEENNLLYPVRPYPEEEPLEDFEKRIVTALQLIVEKKQFKKVVVVSHGAVINRLLYLFSNGEIGSNITHLENCSISTLIYENNTFSIKSANDINYTIHN